MGSKTNEASPGTSGAPTPDVVVARHSLGALLLLLAMAIAPNLHATMPDAADDSIRQFLAQDDAQPAYRATRRLEAQNGGRAIVPVSLESSAQVRFLGLATLRMTYAYSHVNGKPNTSLPQPQN